MAHFGSVDSRIANSAPCCCCTYGYTGYSASRRAFLKSAVVLGSGAVLLRLQVPRASSELIAPSDFFVAIQG